MTISVEQGENQYLMYPLRENGVIADLFDPKYLQREGLLQKSEVAGRARVYFFKHGNYDMVLREYRRGGAVANLSEVKYLWSGLEKSRPWRELRLLIEMKHLQLPVPTPFAALLTKQGLFYRASLITYRLAETQTFAKRLAAGPAPEWLWQRVGGVIRKMHDMNVFHSDLNANNILINTDNAVFLIDFDKSGVRENGHDRWKFDNLERLQRSLKKIHSRHDVFHYSDKAWALLAQGYATRAT